jgi:hypothetical protein
MRLRSELPYFQVLSKTAMALRPVTAHVPDVIFRIRHDNFLGSGRIIIIAAQSTKKD